MLLVMIVDQSERFLVGVKKYAEIINLGKKGWGRIFPKMITIALIEHAFQGKPLFD
jgi:hypothetical protein